MPVRIGQMYKAVVLQLLCALVGVACGAAMYGLAGAISAGLAGLAYVLPSALFAWGLQALARQMNAVYGITLLLGEFIKMFLVVLVLVGIAWVYPGVLWGAVVMGLIITLQANFLAFLVKP